MIDIHSHVLPGIDDGTDSLREAVDFCRAAAADGITDLVATPHQQVEPWWNDEVKHLVDLRRRLARALDHAGIPLRLHGGGEIRVGADLLDHLDDLDAGRPSPVLPLADGRWLLLELSRQVPTPDLEGLLHEMVVSGWRPILAHPEDIHWLWDDPTRFARLVEVGATLQVTAASVTGQRSRMHLHRTRSLLDAGLVAFVASDSHNLTSRPPGLAAVRDELEHRWGSAAARLLTQEHPEAVLADLPLGSAAAMERTPTLESLAS
jgi:protein-tyrosine phosphatase